ncbi:MAG: Gfo/Idh/MocA family oxidoreductase, partial [Verrucomicrobiota bacterium]
GKAVLCEKPLTPSVADTVELTEMARGRGVFLMEAMKTGFMPAIQQARSWIKEGIVGELKLANAEFCFPGSTDPKGRLMNQELAGGAVLDVGIYPIYLVEHLLGGIISIQANGSITETGVEDTVGMISRHQGGATAVMACSFQTELALDAVIRGTKGEIRIPEFHAAQSAELWKDGKLMSKFVAPEGSGRVKPEIRAVHAALAQGLIECPGHDHKHSILLAKRMEEVRTLLGVMSA